MEKLLNVDMMSTCSREAYYGSCRLLVMGSWIKQFFFNVELLVSIYITVLIQKVCRPINVFQQAHRGFLCLSPNLFDKASKIVWVKSSCSTDKRPCKSIALYYISQLARVLGLVNLAGRILLYGTLKFKVGFLAKLFVIFRQVKV